MAQPVPFLEDFDAVLPGAGTGWLDRLRADAQEAFRKAGLPTPRTEAWKYTNLRRLARTGFVAAEANQTTEVTTVPEGIVALEDAYVAVFVNGRFAPSLSSLDGLSEGVEATSLAAKLSADRTSLEGQFSDVTDLPMATLNTGLLSDGLYLKLDDGVALDGIVCNAGVVPNMSSKPCLVARSWLGTTRPSRASSSCSGSTTSPTSYCSAG